MLRNQKLITIDLAADIQTNTNFVLPQRGNTILRRVNNYRQHQRETTSRQTQSAAQKPAIVLKPGDFKPTLGIIRSTNQSSNCKNFMLPDSPRETNYAVSLPYENKLEMKKRPLSTDFQRVSSRKNSPRTSLEPKDQEYLGAVRQASKILRKSMVLNFVETIQRALPIQTSKSLVQAPKPVSQQRINEALKQTVSRTDRQLKVQANEPKRSFMNQKNALHHHIESSLNSVTLANSAEAGVKDSESHRMNNTSIGYRHATGQLGIILASINQRPKSMRIGHTGGQSNNQKMLVIDASSNERPLQNVLSETKASTLNNVKSLVMKDQIASLKMMPQSNFADKITPNLHTGTLSSPQDDQSTQIIPENIKMLGKFQIFVPHELKTSDDKKMRKFVAFIGKGYLKQADQCIQSVRNDYPGRTFNTGLLALLNNEPERAAQILQGYEIANHNYQIAKRLIEQKKVTKDIDPNMVVNQHYFTRTFPYGYQQDLKIESDKLQHQQIKPSVATSDWDYFLMQVKRYKKEDFARFVEDKAYFDKVLKRINHICDQESNLIPNCRTRIISEQEVEKGEAEKIINATQLRDTVLRDAPNLAADKSLQEVFIEMLNIQSAYCVGSKDPIKESFDFLIEGLRTFDEKFGVELFVNEFLVEAAKASVEDIKALLERYNSSDRLILRARTFIMSCFDSEHTQDQMDQSLNVLLRIVREAKEQKLKRMMDPTRFDIESLFIYLVDDIITASRNEKGPGPLATEDQYLADRLNFHRELSGRSKDVHLMKIVEFTKPDLERHQQVERYINQPANFQKIEPGPVSKDIKLEIRKKLQATWERHITKPLSKEELQVVMAEVQQEINEIEEVAMQRHLNETTNASKNQNLIETSKSETFPKLRKKADVKKNLAKYIKKKLEQQQRRLEREEKQKREEQCETITSEEEAEIDEQLEIQKKAKRLEQELLDREFKITSEQVQFGSNMGNLWRDHPGAVNLRQALYKIQLMCDDEKVIFENDKVRLAPLLEKWGIQAEAEKELFEMSQKLSGDNDEVKVQKERPKIGKQIPQSLITYLKTTLNNVKDLFQSQLNKLDEVLVENFRFFSIIDKNVRTVIFKSVELVHFEQKGTVIENDVDETDFVYVVIQGTVDYMLFKHDTNVTVVAATYRTGEVFGDASIQRQYFDVFKCLSKDKKYLETGSQDVYALRIPKKEFVAAIFAEMRVELMFKILLFRNTTYFKELSPYSLVMFASICDVMDYKYGEIVIDQGGIPNACYLIASGQCQSVYHYVEQQSTSVSKHARRVLQTSVSKPIIQSKIDYKNLALIQARDSQMPVPVLPQRKKKQPKVHPKQNSTSQEDGPLIKRAYYHGVLNSDPVNKTIEYENHIPFGEIRQGQVFGARTLLDYTTFNKHVAQNSIRFAEQLGIIAEDWIEDQRCKRNGELKKLQTLSIANKSFKRKAKVCQDCLEKQKSFCQCQQTQVYDVKSTIVSGIEQSQNNNTNDDLSASFLSNGGSPLPQYNSQVDLSANNIQKLTRKGTSVFSRSRHQAKKLEDDFTEETYQNLFIEYMHESLMRSQTSIIVTSATAKLIIIKKEDKTFLNEALKQSIDRVIIDENFQDHDRPLKNVKQVQKTLEDARGWIARKKELEESFLKEAKFNRNLNKLLD